MQGNVLYCKGTYQVRSDQARPGKIRQQGNLREVGKVKGRERKVRN